MIFISLCMCAFCISKFSSVRVSMYCFVLLRGSPEAKAGLELALWGRITLNSSPPASVHSLSSGITAVPHHAQVCFLKFYNIYNFDYPRMVETTTLDIKFPASERWPLHIHMW